MTKIKGTEEAVEKVSTTKKGEASSKKLDAVKAAMSQIESNFGVGAIMKMGEKKHANIETIPTGSLSLDIAVGGGIPKGRITEIYGPESSGKTTLTLHIIAECQKQGGTAAFIDAEHALDPEYARKIGVNIDELLVSQPDNGEQALEIVDTLVRSNAIDLIVVDSVAALTPRAEIEGDMGDSHMGLQARLMSQALRKITGSVSKSHTSIIFINQIRMKIGVMFGNPETTTGGNALKFYASLRLEIRNAGKIEVTTEYGKESVGAKAKVKVVKNKIAPPFKVAEFDIMYNQGISYEGDLIDLATKYNLVRKAGAYFSYKDQTIGQGRENAKDFLKADPKMTQELAAEVMEQARAA
ncbi:recombinase RecA [Candidatus Peregrinibacteria bacterium CG11_big_fil_rev_8_21_14_0_20_41_10]|nr:MAG: recombinase RecA [Candidatus Peregrinibacteria bacterium CG11_big_fil_rev_8_21_14_0_20_41_10]PIZ75873.1 MAG: recombinase RecA [Candidatus Peregrinibacteria bacterium CG_4_10_14_0_2_um_filter_41_8]PJC37928.1 MAG: recombinase RecA [Candidatus Peregrinibacteria bacterium CG_4_9_14_0_2_um_filter_41_14]